MKPAGYILKVDQLGRIVIPKPLRKNFDLEPGDSLELFSEDNGILMKKYITGCAFCGGGDNFVKFRDKTICENCLKELKDM